MPRFRIDQNSQYGATAIRDAESGGELLSPGIRARPGASFFDAWEAAIKRTVADKERGRRTAQIRAVYAALAALHSYRAVYGDEVWGGVEPLMDTLRQFWLDRFREGYPLPERLSTAPYKEAPAPREDSTPSPGPSKAVEGNGR